jgi:hypothetical protein
VLVDSSGQLETAGHQTETRVEIMLRENGGSVGAGKPAVRRMIHGKFASENGRLYTPTRSTKGRWRYFYYTLLDEVGPSSTQSVRCLRAAEIAARSSTRWALSGGRGLCCRILFSTVDP